VNTRASLLRATRQDVRDHRRRARFGRAGTYTEAALMALLDDGEPLWRSETEKRSFIDAVLASPTDASPLLGRSLSDPDRWRQRYGSDRLHETSMPAPTAW
jgi:hypothetical protein